MGLQLGQTRVWTLCGLLPRAVSVNELRRCFQERHVAGKTQVQHVRRSQLPEQGVSPKGMQLHLSSKQA